MQRFKNNVQLIGHLGKNPEVITLENGTKVAKLLLATNEYRKNAQGEKQTHTSWHHLTAWGVQASIAERFLIKGKQILVNGRLSQKSYISKDGTKKMFTEIIVNNLQTIA